MPSAIVNYSPTGTAVESIISGKRESKLALGESALRHDKLESNYQRGAGRGRPNYIPMMTRGAEGGVEIV